MCKEVAASVVIKRVKDPAVVTDSCVTRQKKSPAPSDVDLDDEELKRATLPTSKQTFGGSIGLPFVGQGDRTQVAI